MMVRTYGESRHTASWVVMIVLDAMPSDVFHSLSDRIQPLLEQPWPQTVAEATAIQQSLRDRVEMSDRVGTITTVAGVDVGFEDNYAVTKAAVVVLDAADLSLLDWAIARIPTTFPYIPGFLSFREVPALLRSLAQLSVCPDVLLCDGQGLAHPRRFGLACHLGVLLDLPTIGVAKSRLIGTHAEVPPTKGNWQPLMDQDERIGAVLRSRDRVNPLYVSSGHRLSLETAIAQVLACTTRYRLPETTRWADRLASDKTGNVVQQLNARRQTAAPSQETGDRIVQPSLFDAR
jgi:deoxyribonuclease V